MTTNPCQVPATAVSSWTIFPKFRFPESRENFPNIQLRMLNNAEREEFMDSLNNYGIIIRELRKIANLSIQNAANKIGKSAGWLCEVENGSGNCRLSATDFEAIVQLLNGSDHRPMFRTWVANSKNTERFKKTFDGAVLKFIRQKKGLTLKNAAQLIQVSFGYLSKLENGIKPVDIGTRNKIMIAYGYSPSSFKNLSTDPVRSKSVPNRFKFQILMKKLNSEQAESFFESFLQNLNDSKFAK